MGVQKPGYVDEKPSYVNGVDKLAPLICQHYDTRADICTERAENVFGPAWRELRKRRDNLSTSETAKTKEMQGVLNTLVAGMITRCGLKHSRKCATILTLTFAKVLHPERHVIAKIFEHLSSPAPVPLPDEDTQDDVSAKVRL